MCTDDNYLILVDLLTDLIDVIVCTLVSILLVVYIFFFFIVYCEDLNVTVLSKFDVFLLRSINV